MPKQRIVFLQLGVKRDSAMAGQPPRYFAGQFTTVEKADFDPVASRDADCTVKTDTPDRQILYRRGLKAIPAIEHRSNLHGQALETSALALLRQFTAIRRFASSCEFSVGKRGVETALDEFRCISHVREAPIAMPAKD